jgi:hypothetical protein
MVVGDYSDLSRQVFTVSLVAGESVVDELSGDDEEDAEIAASTVKTPAQKKAEKKERDRLKKEADKAKDKAKKVGCAWYGTTPAIDQGGEHRQPKRRDRRRRNVLSRKPSLKSNRSLTNCCKSKAWYEREHGLCRLSRIAQGCREEF